MSTEVESGFGLEREGLEPKSVKWNLSTAALYEEAVRRQEGVLVAHGPLACRTGQHTGRSPNDKFVVRDADGRPEVVLAGRARERADELGVSRVLISLSHTHTTAIAVAILETAS